MQSNPDITSLQMKLPAQINTALFQQAQNLTGIKDETLLLEVGLRALIERETARQWAKIGGSEPQARDIPRRRMGLD